MVDTGTESADVLRVRTDAYALVCGCVVCGRVGSLMLLPADADECKQKQKNSLGMVDADALHASTLA